MATKTPCTQRVLTASLRSLSLTRTASTTSIAIAIPARFASTTSSSSSSSSSASSSYERSRIPRLPPVARLPSRIKPSSPAYYTGRPAYIDTLLSLEQLARQTKRLLEQAHLIPANSPPPSSSMGNGGSSSSGRQNLWVNTSELEQMLGCNLKAAQYRQIISRLGLLARYSSLVIQLEAKMENLAELELNGSSEYVGLVDTYHKTLERFMNENAKNNNLLAEKNTDHALWQASLRKFDAKGRTYSKGRRKESSAQVWIVRHNPSSSSDSSLGQILVNNIPLVEYFTRTCERETVTWPLKLTSTLGIYNVFALTRGGGKSGQAGAIAHALANAIVTETGLHLDINQGLPIKKYLKDLLAKDGVLKRDPRMVERKKTGKAKARKAFTWVKR